MGLEAFELGLGGFGAGFGPGDVKTGPAEARRGRAKAGAYKVFELHGQAAAVQNARAMLANHYFHLVLDVELSFLEIDFFELLGV